MLSTNTVMPDFEGASDTRGSNVYIKYIKSSSNSGNIGLSGLFFLHKVIKTKI